MNRLILQIYLILSSLIYFSDCLICYSCSSCDDPFQAGSYIAYTYPDHSGYYCRKTSSSYSVTRDASTICTQNDTPSDGQWCCQTDRCNHAMTLIPRKTFFILIFVLFK